VIFFACDRLKELDVLARRKLTSNSLQLRPPCFTTCTSPSHLPPRKQPRRLLLPTRNSLPRSNRRRRLEEEERGRTGGRNRPRRTRGRTGGIAGSECQQRRGRSVKEELGWLGIVSEVLHCFEICRRELKRFGRAQPKKNEAQHFFLPFFLLPYAVGYSVLAFTQTAHSRIDAQTHYNPFNNSTHVPFPSIDPRYAAKGSAATSLGGRGLVQLSRLHLILDDGSLGTSGCGFVSPAYL